MRRLLPLLLLAALLGGCAQATAGADEATVARAVTQPPAVTTTLAPTRLLTVTPTLAAPPTATASPETTPIPTRVPSPTPCAEPHGTVITDSVPSAYLRYNIDMQIYLPPCYGIDRQQRYPVLYLVHGLNFTEDQWVRLGAADTADALIKAGDIAPLIIVMPRDRRDIGLDPAFVTDLLPYIDATYPTLDDREQRAIGGLSRGAGWALHLGLRYPELFGRIGGHSPVVFLGDDVNVLSYIRAIARDGPVPALYLDVGNTDTNRQSAAWLDQNFTWFKFDHTYLLQPGGHTEEYWSSHVADYLRFYAEDWLNQTTPRATPILLP